MSEILANPLALPQYLLGRRPGLTDLICGIAKIRSTLWRNPFDGRRLIAATIEVGLARFIYNVACNSSLGGLESTVYRSTHIPDDNTITDVDAPEVLTNPADGLTYVWIPPGKFIMGCSPADIDVRDHPDDPYSRCWHQEEPAHQVTLTGGFWLGQTVVTGATYQRVLGVAPPGDHDSRSPDGPVWATWDEAQSYCQAVGGRLPTEAEWEYAARAGSTKGYDDRTSSQVAEKPNAFGVYVRDTRVSEWTADWYGTYAPDPSVDPAGPSSGQQRSVRSSGFGRYSWDHRLSYRVGLPQSDRTVGFRCAKTLIEAK